MYKFLEGYYADVRIEDRFASSISYLDRQLRECKETVIKKAFIRVFDGNMWYYASTSEVDEVQEELNKLYSNAQKNADILNHPIVKLYEVNKDTVLKYADDCVKKVSLNEKRALLEKSIDSFDGVEHLKMVGSSYRDIYKTIEFYSSLGAEIKYDWQTVQLIHAPSFAKNENIFDSNIQSVKLSYKDVPFCKERIKSFIAECQTFLDAKPATPGEFPVILSPIVAGVFAHESFGHKSEADLMLGNEKMKQDWQIGKKVGSDLISIYDSGNHEGTGYVPYDDEGTKAKKTYLIKNGILSGRLHSASTAAALGEGITGNARALNCDFEPIVRMTSTIIEGGDTTFEELVARIKRGYYIKEFKHGSGMSTFTIAPTFAYEIVDGKIGAPVKISVITGTVFETMSLIDGVSDKVEIISSAGGCGKMEQAPLPVSDGGPFVSVSKMTVQ